MPTIEREKLIGVLENVSPGLGTGKKDTNDQFLSFVFTGDDVLTYNDEVFASHPLDLPIQGAIRGNILLPFLEKLNGEEVDLDQDDTKLLVKSGRVESGISMNPEFTIPISSLSPPKEFHKIPDGFFEGLKFCQFSASKDMRKKALTCFHITEKYMETCDNFRISRWKMKGWKGETLLPARYLKPINDFPFTITKYGTKKGWIYFKGKGKALIACRTESDKFPDLGKLLKVKGEKITLPKNLVESLDRVGLFTDEMDDSLYIQISVKGKTMELNGENSFGWITEKIPVKYKGGSINFDIEPTLLQEILSHSNEAVVGTTRMKFSDDSFEHIIILRVGE